MEHVQECAQETGDVEEDREEKRLEQLHFQITEALQVHAASQPTGE